MIIIAVAEAALLLAVHRVVGGIEVEDQVLGRGAVGGDELVDQDLGDADQGRAIDAVLEAAEVGGEASVASSTGGRPAAIWRTGSSRRVWWSLRSSSPRARAMIRWASRVRWGCTTRGANRRS